MKTMGISHFKAHALQVLDCVAQTQEEVVITKRGKPLAQIVPFRHLQNNPQPGQLANTFVFEKDIVSPLGEDSWESCQ